MSDDGTGDTRLLMHLEDPTGVAVDPIGQRLYTTLSLWGDSAVRANLDGSDFEIITPPGRRVGFGPENVRLGPFGQRIYSAALDGSDLQQVPSTVVAKSL